MNHQYLNRNLSDKDSQLFEHNQSPNFQYHFFFIISIDLIYFHNQFRKIYKFLWQIQHYYYYQMLHHMYNLHIDRDITYKFLIKCVHKKLLDKLFWDYLESIPHKAFFCSFYNYLRKSHIQVIRFNHQNDILNNYQLYLCISGINLIKE